MKQDLSITRLNGLALVSVEDLKKIFSESEIKEIIATTPVIRKFGQDYVRAAEIDSLEHRAIDEDTAQYDLFDLYRQSSNHILAAISVLRVCQKHVSDLNDDAQKIVNKIYLDSERDIKVLRKNVIELLLQSIEERKK